jgi:hypothetical protein
VGREIAASAGFAGRVVVRKISENLIFNHRREFPEPLFFRIQSIKPAQVSRVPP